MSSSSIETSMQRRQPQLKSPHQLPTYPHATFTTTYLDIDRAPIVFTDAHNTATCPAHEPYRAATLTSVGPVTSRSLNIASAALASSLPVAFPTETVYGLAANALSQLACNAIFTAKGRPQDNPLIVHVSDLDMAETIIRKDWQEPRAYEALMRAFWPGGITFLVPAARQETDTPAAASPRTALRRSSLLVGKGTSPLPLVVSASHPLVGIRMPSHPLARALIAQTQLPLAAPSANASGRPSPTTAQHVMYDLGGPLDAHRIKGQAENGSQSEGSKCSGSGRGRIPYILDGGASRQGVESTVVDGVTSAHELRILRPGAVSLEEIEECLSSADLLASSFAPDSQSLQTVEASVVGDIDDAQSGKVRLRVYGKDMTRQASFESNPTTPGMKYRHYSPTAPVVLFSPVEGEEGGEGAPDWEQALAQEVLAFSQARYSKRQASHPVLSKRFKVGLMLQFDSPLAKTILLQDDLHNHSALRKWLAVQGTALDQEAYEMSIGEGESTSSSSSYRPTQSLGPSFPLSLISPKMQIAEFNDTEKGRIAKVNVEVYPFSLGSHSLPHLAAQRLFYGLRVLDEGPLLVQPDVDGSSDGPLGEVVGGETAASPYVDAEGGGGVDLIIIQAVQDQGVGLAVMNRVGKAAGKTVRVKV